MVVPSADISEFNILTQFDISLSTPQICLQADSVGVNEALVNYIYKITSPSDVLLHEGSFISPDATGNSAIFCVDLNPFNGSIEWSGGDYVIIATMQDTALNEWSQTILVSVCPPRGNPIPGLWYGQSNLSPEVKCESAEILFLDTTNYDYKGLTKTLVSKTMTLIFPADPDTGIQPSPVVVTGLSAAAFAITYNGMYEGRLVTIYDYDAGSGITIRIKYTTLQKKTGTHKPIAVECQTDLCPFLCEFAALIDETEALCGVNDVQYVENQRLISLINSKIALVLIRQKCGQPVGDLITEIINLGNFKCNCDCGNNGITSRGIIPTASPTYVFNTVNSCGDIVGTFSNPSGNNIVLTLADKKYVFAIDPSMRATGFSMTNAVVGCQKTYTLFVDQDALITKLLDTIDNNVTLKAAFCAIVAQCDPNNPFAGVDMLCISPTLNNQCDYYAQLVAGQAFPSDKFVGIVVNGLLYSPPVEYVYTNATQINLWLATLPFGFAGTEYVNSSGTIDFTALTNLNSITRLRFKRGFGPPMPYDVYVSVSNCASTPGTTDKMQALVTFVCQIYTALFGPSPVLYKVKVGSDADTTPDYIDQKVQSDDSSVQISVIGEKVNFRTIQKVTAGDNCAGYLVDKIISNYFDIDVIQNTIYAYNYVITSTVYGAGKNIFSININGTNYPLNILSTDLAAIEAAINAIGLGTFTATSPAANLVITSVGNRYVVASAVMVTLAGPTYATFNAVQSTPVSLGDCAQLRINPLARTWTNITLDAGFDPILSTAEYSSLDSLRNVMINLNIVADPSPIISTININAGDLIPIGLRPRTDQKILIWSGWNGSSDNIGNYILISTGGLIQVEYNLSMTDQTFRIDSFIYPTN